MTRDALREAVHWVGRGGLLAYPTETVWGLGADARSDTALERLREFKGRDSDAPISILVEAASALPGLGFEPNPVARALAKQFWPGPLTLVMPCAQRFAKGVARPDGAVGVRCSPHPAASALARSLAAEGVGPVTATSLNRRGVPAARTRDEAQTVVGASGARLLGLPEEAGGGRESTVVDVCGARPEVLRHGAIDDARLEDVLAEVPAA